jgi:hypothetical protein
MDHQPVRRATEFLKPGRDLLLEAVMVAAVAPARRIRAMIAIEGP